MVFDFDWWQRGGLASQIEEAKNRCARAKAGDAAPADGAVPATLGELETRIIVYLRDSAIYEMKEIVQNGRSDYLTFECLPAEEAYRVGAFVVSVPFDEIARVEVFAVHPSEKPDDSPWIRGFGASAGPGAGRSSARPVSPDQSSISDEDD